MLDFQVKSQKRTRNQKTENEATVDLVVHQPEGAWLADGRIVLQKLVLQLKFY